MKIPSHIQIISHTTHKIYKKKYIPPNLIEICILQFDYIISDGEMIYYPKNAQMSWAYGSFKLGNLIFKIFQKLILQTQFFFYFTDCNFFFNRAFTTKKK